MGALDSCYQLFIRENGLTWYDASNVCEAKGGQLVSITNLLEMKVIKFFLLYPWLQKTSRLKELNIFIGLQTSRDNAWDTGRAHRLRWTNGDPYVYSEWFPADDDKIYNYLSSNADAYVPGHHRQPTLDQASRCTLMMMHNPRHHANWARFPCFANLKEPAFICERPAGGKSGLELQTHFKAQMAKIRGQTSTCEDGWLEVEGRCLMLFSRPAQQLWNGSEAEAYCRNHWHANLASPSSDLGKIDRILTSIWRFNRRRGQVWMRDGNPQPRFPTFVFNVAIQGISSQPPTLASHVLCERPMIHLNKTCGIHEFACPEGYCISVTRLCDDVRDCAASGSDEASCEHLQDPALRIDSDQSLANAWDARAFFKQLYCPGTKTSVPWSAFCDPKVPCLTADRSHQMCRMPTCPSTPHNPSWRCDNGECIPAAFYCDGVRGDCIDGSDESACRGKDCRGFQCSTGDCIPRRFVNDSQVDCDGLLGEDEQDNKSPDLDCPLEDGEQCVPGRPHCFSRRLACRFDVGREGKQECPNNEHLSDCRMHPCPGMFQCPDVDNYCLPLHHVCDQDFDCPGGADEAGCARQAASRLCPKGSLRCRLDKPMENSSKVVCVSREYICDGVMQCPGGDDELFCSVRADQVPAGCSIRAFTANCPSATEASLVSLPHTIRQLNLDGNTAIKSLHSGIFDRLPYLGHLSIRRTGLRALPSWTFSANEASISNIVFLDLSDNNITNINSLAFYGLDRLRHLNLSGNPVSEFEMDTFYSLTGLQTLDLSNTRLHSLQSRAFHGLANLTRLNLSNTAIQNINADAFDCHRVRALDLRKNSLQMFIHKKAFALVQIDRLTTDHVKYCCLALHAKDCYPKGDVVSNCDDLLASPVLQVSRQTSFRSRPNSKSALPSRCSCGSSASQQSSETLWCSLGAPSQLARTSPRRGVGRPPSSSSTSRWRTS